MIGQPFICMDYYDYDGRTLQEIIEGGPLGVGEAMEVVHRGARCGWPPPRPRFVAVLAFANMSADAEREYFCDGIAEDIINALTSRIQLEAAAQLARIQTAGAGGHRGCCCLKGKLNHAGWCRRSGTITGGGSL